jgi:long-chain acyl-CoA synthetase
MVNIPQRILGEALILSTLRNPSKCVIINKNIEYTYSMLRECAEKLASYLVNSGIKKGDRVAVYMNNSWEAAVSIYGITISGAVFLIINPQTKAKKLEYILKDSGALTLISESLMIHEFLKIYGNAPNLHEIIINEGTNRLPIQCNIKITDFKKIFLSNDPLFDFPTVIPNDLAAIIYTSGSSGVPKGVMMTHQSMVFTSWSLIEYLRLTEEDRIILFLPLAFDYGLYQLLMAVTLGAFLIVEPSFTLPNFLYKQIERYKATIFPGVPMIYAIMIETYKSKGLCFDHVKKITNTGAALPSEFIGYLKKIFPNALIFKMYGLTECKRVCYLEPELIDIKTESVGKAIPGTEVFLLSPEGNHVPIGESGILHIRGPHIMLGYWKNEKLSKTMLKPGNLPGEKILCSNDWFKMDEENFLYFLGRTDDIIKSRGEKVSPIEVENIIYTIKGIKQVSVIGISDLIIGEAIIAFVTTFNQYALNEKEILKVCNLNLEPFMVPQKIIFLNEMPKCHNGKIDKKKLLINFENVQ